MFVTSGIQCTIYLKLIVLDLAIVATFLHNNNLEGMKYRVNTQTESAESSSFFTVSTFDHKNPELALNHRSPFVSVPAKFFLFIG